MNVLRFILFVIKAMSLILVYVLLRELLSTSKFVAEYSAKYEGFDVLCLFLLGIFIGRLFNLSRDGI